MRNIIAIWFFLIIISLGLSTKVYAVEWTDEAAIAMQNATDSGMDPYEASAAVLGITVNGPINNKGSGTSTPSTPAQAPATTATPAPTANEPTAETHSHDYDEISDAAKEAFVYFTHDGTPDSVYLNIKTTSSQNVITGKELNATTTGKEDGKISFVDEEGEILEEWYFSNWLSDEEYTLDLTSVFNKYETEDFDEAYKLSFSDGKAINENVIDLRIQTGKTNTDLNIYSGEPDDNGQYKLICTSATDENGFLTFQPTELTEFIISPGNQITPKEEVEEVQEVKMEDSNIQENVSIQEEIKTDEKVNDEPIPQTTEQPTNKPFLKIIAFVFVILIICMIILVFVKKRRK